MRQISSFVVLVLALSAGGCRAISAFSDMDRRAVVVEREYIIVPLEQSCHHCGSYNQVGPRDWRCWVR